MRPLRPADEKGLKKVYLAYLLLLNAHAVMNFAPQAIIPSSQQSAVFSDSPAIILVLSTADPKTHCSGSAGALPALSGQETQYAAVLLASLTLYVVSLPCPATARSPPENAALLIPCAWYTSGKLLYVGKSDLPETVIR